jgi:uncharacterized membrane-anchored protein
MHMRVKALLFGLVVIAQLGALAWMIRDHEQVLENGRVYRFRTAPIDPRDPFRGEYVVLDFAAEEGHWPLPDSNAFRAYAWLAEDNAGYATIAALRMEPPPDGSDHVRVTFGNWGGDTVHRVELPFDRFYLEEGDGAATEQLLQPVWEVDTVIQPLPAHAVVRVYKGEAVIEDLVVDGRSIHTWLNEVAVP